MKSFLTTSLQTNIFKYFFCRFSNYLESLEIMTVLFLKPYTLKLGNLDFGRNNSYTHIHTYTFSFYTHTHTYNLYICVCAFIYLYHLPGCLQMYELLGLLGNIAWIVFSGLLSLCCYNLAFLSSSFPCPFFFLSSSFCFSLWDRRLHVLLGISLLSHMRPHLLGVNHSSAEGYDWTCDQRLILQCFLHKILENRRGMQKKNKISWSQTHYVKGKVKVGNFFGVTQKTAFLLFLNG